MGNQSGNQTPNTPTVNESELGEMKVDELRSLAQERHVSGASDMRKDELVKAVVEAERKSGAGEDAGPDDGHVRTGKETSGSLKYSQEITSTDDEPEREGRSLATTHHDVIRRWAEARGGVPATVEGTEHDDHLGVLRFDFGGDNQQLRHVSWEQWFETFDSRRLNFIYQEQRSDGDESNFFRLENPNREDT